MDASYGGDFSAEFFEQLLVCVLVGYVFHNDLKFAVFFDLIRIVWDVGLVEKRRDAAEILYVAEVKACGSCGIVTV